MGVNSINGAARRGTAKKKRVRISPSLVFDGISEVSVQCGRREVGSSLSFVHSSPLRGFTEVMRIEAKWITSETDPSDPCVCQY